MAERRDFLSVCNDQGVPLPDFQATFCVRCVQPECSRSKAGGLFESRVATWQDRLFVNPPRMPADDPLYASISAKKFRDMEVGRTPEVGRGLSGASVWVDPLALDEAPREPKPLPRPASRNSVPSTVDAEAAAEVSLQTTPEPPRAKPELPTNSPFAQGTMIGGAAAPKPTDPWALAPPLESSPSSGAAAPVVSAGAKIRFRTGSK